MTVIIYTLPLIEEMEIGVFFIKLKMALSSAERYQAVSVSKITDEYTSVC